MIDFVNALFAEAFPGENTRLDPRPALGAGGGRAGGRVRLGARGRGRATRKTERKANREERQKRGEQKPGVDGMRRAEAAWLARLIRTRLDAGWMVRDRATKQVRRAEEKDVAFLFRAMTDLAPYENALKAEGLDFHVVGGKAFYAQQEVLDLVNVLSVIEDPLDAVALAGALRGPFFGLSDDALLPARRRRASCRPRRRPGTTPRRSTASPTSTAPAPPAPNDLLARWRGLKDRVPIAELVDRVLDESGFEAALLGEFLGDRKRANARKLVRLARRFDARGGFTLGHFVNRLRDDLRQPPREEQASTTEEEGKSVRLMSIHQAKGLEFPIVIVPDLNRKQDLPRRPVAFHPELGPLVRPASTPDRRRGRRRTTTKARGDSLGWVAYEAVERVEEEAESVRLFYVATTRARDHLILSAGGGPDVTPVSAAMRLLDQRFDRRSGSFKAALPDGCNAPAVRVTTECPPRSASARGRMRRPGMRAVARLIEKASEPRPPAEPIAPRRPRFVDLDAARALARARTASTGSCARSWPTPRDLARHARRRRPDRGAPATAARPGRAHARGLPPARTLAVGQARRRHREGHGRGGAGRPGASSNGGRSFRAVPSSCSAWRTGRAAPSSSARRGRRRRSSGSGSFFRPRGRTPGLRAADARVARLPRRQVLSRRGLRRRGDRRSGFPASQIVPGKQDGSTPS